MQITEQASVLGGRPLIHTYGHLMKSVLHQILDRSGFSPVTRSNYAHVIDRWIEFAGADPIGWTRDKAQDFYDQLIADGLSVQSANIYIHSLRYVSKWYASKSGEVDFAVVQKQRGTKGRSRSQTRKGGPTITQDEMRALLETCHERAPIDMRDLALLVVGIETGMRRISFRGTAFEGLTTAEGGYPIARVPIKGAGGEEVFDVPLSDTSQLALAPWLDWLRAHKTKTGPIYRRVSPRGQNYDIGDVLSLTGFNELVAARCKAAGIRPINPHMLRHTFITWRTDAGLSPLEISAITGHKVSIVSIGGVAMRIGDMRTYFHADIHKIRNTTPSWLADLVKELCS